MWFFKILYLCLFRELCFITNIQIKLCCLILYYSQKIIQATQQKCFLISRHVYYTIVAHSWVSVCPLKIHPKKTGKMFPVRFKLFKTTFFSTRLGRSPARGVASNQATNVAMTPPRSETLKALSFHFVFLGDWNLFTNVDLVSIQKEGKKLHLIYETVASSS